MKKPATRRNMTLPASRLPAYARAVRRLRDAVGLTHAKLARPLNVSAASISLWESGSRKPSEVNFAALKAFALKKGFQRLAGPFEIELQKLTMDREQGQLLQVVLKRSKAGNEYAKRLLEASERPVRDYAEEKAAAYFDAFLESPERWHLLRDVRAYPSVKLGFPPAPLPAGDQRAPAMLAAIHKEMHEVDLLRQARKVGKRKDHILLASLIVKGVTRRWKDHQAARQRGRAILDEALQEARQGKRIDAEELLAKFSLLLSETVSLGEDLGRLELLKKETGEVLERVAEQIRRIYNASRRPGESISDEDLDQFLKALNISWRDIGKLSAPGREQKKVRENEQAEI